jgi:hypothetical protein
MKRKVTWERLFQEKETDRGYSPIRNIDVVKLFFFLMW